MRRRHKHPKLMIRRPTQSTLTPMHEMTKEQLQSRIYELEGRLTQIQKDKRPSCRKVMAEERVIQEINILRKKLEAKQKEKKKDATGPKKK